MTTPASERPAWLESSRLLRVLGAGALLVLLFATNWYGHSIPADGPFATARSGALDAWSTLSLLRWVVLVAGLVAPMSVLVPVRWTVDLALALGLLATAGLFYRLLIALPDPHTVLDVKLGGYLALVACAALTLGAWEAEAPRRR